MGLSGSRAPSPCYSNSEAPQRWGQTDMPCSQADRAPASKGSIIILAVATDNTDYCIWTQISRILHQGQDQQSKLWLTRLPQGRVTNVCSVSDVEACVCNPHANEQNRPGGCCRKGVCHDVTWTEKEIPQFFSALIDANSTANLSWMHLVWGAEGMGRLPPSRFLSDEI